MIECEKFTGRKRDICEGSVLTLAKCNAYRVLWGLPLLVERDVDGNVTGLAERTVTHLSTPVAKTGVQGKHNSKTNGHHGNHNQKLSHGKSPSPILTPAPNKRITPNPPKPVPTGGVGTELERLFAGWTKYLDIASDPEHDAAPLDAETFGEIAAAGQASCLGCQGLAGVMNRWGPDGCEKNIDDIVERIKSNAGRHKIKLTGKPVSSLPFFGVIVRRFVAAAIARTRGD